MSKTIYCALQPSIKRSAINIHTYTHTNKQTNKQIFTSWSNYKAIERATSITNALSTPEIKILDNQLEFAILQRRPLHRNFTLLKNTLRPSESDTRDLFSQTQKKQEICQLFIPKRNRGPCLWFKWYGNRNNLWKWCQKPRMTRKKCLDKNFRSVSQINLKFV